MLSDNIRVERRLDLLSPWMQYKHPFSSIYVGTRFLRYNDYIYARKSTKLVSVKRCDEEHKNLPKHTHTDALSKARRDSKVSFKKQKRKKSSAARNRKE